MKLVYTTHQLTTLYSVRLLLESNGIYCEIHNELSTSMIGEIPSDQAWPEIYVAEKDFDKASHLIDNFNTHSIDIPSFCPKCDSEDIERVQSREFFTSKKFKCRGCGYTWKKR